MSRKLPSTYSLYDTTYNHDFPLEQYFVIMFDSLSSRHASNQSYDSKIIEYFINEGFKLVATHFSTNKREDEFSTSHYIHHDKRMIVKFHTDTFRKKNLIEVELFYDVLLGDLKKQLDWEKIKTFEKKKEKSNINLIKSENGHLNTEEFYLPHTKMDLPLNYGEPFAKIHDIIIKRLNTEYDKGIILLHGDPGTGKTSYIKYLTNLVKEKEILFIPPSMAEILSEPSFIPFLMDYRNSILIIEDAERVISDRETNGSPTGVSNILNLTDGILGDCLGIQIIATFNMKKEKIDQALLRKGRLIAEHKFDKLSVEATNKLLKKLGKNKTVNTGMVLSDIYNIDVEQFKSTEEKNKIGF